MVEKSHKEAVEDHENEVTFVWQWIYDTFDAIDFWYNQLLFLKHDHMDYGKAESKVTFFFEEMQAILTTHITVCRFIQKKPSESF